MQRYVADKRLARQYPTVLFTGLAVVFHGGELAHAAAVAPPRATMNRAQGRDSVPGCAELSESREARRYLSPMLWRLR